MAFGVSENLAIYIQSVRLTSQVSVSLIDSYGQSVTLSIAVTPHYVPARNEIVRHHVHRIKTAELRTGKVRGLNHGIYDHGNFCRLPSKDYSARVEALCSPFSRGSGHHTFYVSLRSTVRDHKTTRTSIEIPLQSLEFFRFV